MLINRQLIVQVTLTVDTNAYTANDVVGGLITFNIANVGAGGVVRWARLVDDDNEKAEMNLYLFNSLPSTIADDAAFAPTVADLKKMVGKISFAASEYETINSNAINIQRGSADGVDIDFYTSGDNIFGYLVAVSTPAYTAATDLHITLGVWLDG